MVSNIILNLCLAFGISTVACAAPAKWVQSYDAGYRDKNGAWAGGSEIMHLAAHGGKLFAANGYWLDARWVIPPEGQKQSAQVLRLDKADGRWQVDLDLGRANDLGLEFMKGNILKSVSFSTTGEGRVLNAPVQLLVMAAGANFERGGAVSGTLSVTSGSVTSIGRVATVRLSTLRM